MEFGIHDDYIPDYGVVYGLKMPFYLFDPCEENYKYVNFIMEFGSFITSFFLFFPHIYINIFSKEGTFLPQTQQISKNLLYSGIASLFYHGYVCYITQFFDMLTIVWTFMRIINDLNVPFSNNQQYIIIIMFFCGIFHPLLTAFSMLYLIFKVGGFLLKDSLLKGRYEALAANGFLLISLLLIMLDIIMCPYQIFRYFHAMWHFTAFLAFSFLIKEFEFHLREKKISK